VLFAGGGASGGGGVNIEVDDTVAVCNGKGGKPGSSLVGDSNNRIGDAERYELPRFAEGCSTVGSGGSSLEASNSSCVSAVCREDVGTEFHGFSNGAAATERPPLTVAQGLLEGPIVDGWRTGNEEEGSSSPQAPRVSRLRNSAVFSVISPSPLTDDVDNPLKSLATPSYASWTTENAAEALDENFPHTDLTPLPPKRSGFGAVRVRFEGVE